MISIEEAIKVLEELKKQWNDKYAELIEYAKSYVVGNDPEYISDFQQKLYEISGELSLIGKKYHQEVDKIADHILKDHKDNPIIQTLMNDFKSDVVDSYSYSVYQGNREARLKDMAEIIGMFDKMTK